MARTAKISRGSWCLGFGFEQPATLEQVARVLSAFEYDGIELGGFFDHATVERYPDRESRPKLKKRLKDDLGLELCVDCEIPAMRIDPGDFGPLPGDADVGRAWDRVVTIFREHAEKGAEAG